MIHELLCHPDIDVMAVDSDGATAEKLACAHIKNILLTFKWVIPIDISFSANGMEACKLSINR